LKLIVNLVVLVCTILPFHIKGKKKVQTWLNDNSHMQVAQICFELFIFTKWKIEFCGP